MSARPAAARSLWLLRLGPVPHSVLSWLERPIAELFDARVRKGGAPQEALDARFPQPEEVPEGTEAPDPSRPLASDEALDAVVAARPGPEDWTLAISARDLRSPDGQPVFGEATVEGCCAVVNAHHLDPSSHGLVRNPERFRRRLIAESLHELAHVAGLGHCSDPNCVMFASSSLAETDRKDAPCLRCAALLRVRLGLR